MARKILISGAGGSLFPYLHYKLLELDFDPFYVDFNEELGKVYPFMRLFKAPKVDHADYPQFVKEICIKNDIRIYVPLIDEEIITAIEIGNEIENLSVIAPEKEFAGICLNKLALMKLLKDEKISNISTYKGSEFRWQFEPPVFVKPNSGRGSRGVRIINNKDELNAYFVLEKYTPEEVIIQPCIKGTEYTIGVLVNKRNEILSICPRRIIYKKGITINAVSENNIIIENLAGKITEKMVPRGPFNIQLFIDKEGKPSIFEINPRFSTTLVFSYEVGIDEISLFIDGSPPPDGKILKSQDNLFLYRAWNNIFYKN